MTHKPWDFTKRLTDVMADSSIPPAKLAHSERSPGVHLSTLLRKLHPIDPKKAALDDALDVMGLLGLAFEDRMERALQHLSKQEDWPWHSFRPSEVHSDEGVACSPDFIMLPKRGDMPVRELSCKCTWKSATGWPREEGENGFDPKFGYYLDQSMGYSTPLDTLGGFLVCYFVRSNYKEFVPSPAILGIELEWSHQERDELWTQLMAIAAEGD